MKVLHKIFLILCRVFTTLWKRRKINIDIDHDGSSDITIEIGTHSENKWEDKQDGKQ